MQECFSRWGCREGGTGAVPFQEGVAGKMPPSLGACHRFSPQIEEQLRKAEGKMGKKVLSESDYMEVLERSCSKSWER